MKSVLVPAVIVMAILTVSCFNMGKDQYYMKMTGAVEISYASIPDTVAKLDTARIVVKAQAFDACWSNLRFVLSLNAPMEYNLQAIGTYESYGNCPEMMVYGDSTIAFVPAQPGLYKFYVYKGPNITETDTLIVTQ
jgi:hypothetical protein